MILYELALDDIDNENVTLLDKKRFYYIDKNGKHLRHAKIVFKTHRLQKSLVSKYRYHDPTKVQDGCIHVLLGKIGKKWFPISTLRKLDAKCILKHKDTYASVPKYVYDKALKFTEGLSDEEKERVKKAISKLKFKIAGPVDKKERPIFIMSKEDVFKKLYKKK